MDADMVLLDTCTLLWLASDQEKLSDTAREIIADNAGNIFVSSITSLEIAIKHFKKKLVLPTTPHQWIPAVMEHHGIFEIPVDSMIAIASASLPALHNDPADRIIVATAKEYRMTVLTPDRLISVYKDIIVRW